MQIPERRLRLLKYLSIYYAGLQALHLVIIGSGLIRYLREARIGFPAPPPPSGWSSQATAFLIGNGAMDAIIAILSLIYLYTFLTERRGSWLLGLISLTGSICSAVFFAFGTFISGAWAAHPMNYWALVLIFTPIILLYSLLVRTLVEGIEASPLRA
jgi:hypothetical protein